jgi:hypothetical protein
MTTKRMLLVSLLAESLLIGSGVSASLLIASHSADADEVARDEPVTAFFTVDLRDLTDTTTAAGTLDYGDQEPLAGVLGGTVTGLPEAGAIIDRGGILYSIDNSPITLMIGDLPAWRSFDVSMSDGPDVTQLEENLAALGFFGDQPDDRFDWVTREAVRDWQESLGMVRTGLIELGRVVFESQPRRVGSLDIERGAQTGPGMSVLTLTSQSRVVTVQLPINEQGAALPDTDVTLQLPDGSRTSGKVASVGTPTEVDEGGDKRVVVPVKITLNDAAAAGELHRLSVTVLFQKGTYEQILVAPVTALIALSGGGIGVEKITADGIVRVPVTTGVFVQGFVEITGGEIAEGDEVVVPE